jgi:hypothetical protein
VSSKALQRFTARVREYSSDIELSDILIRRFLRTPDSNQSVCDAVEGRSDQYPILHNRVNTRQSRNIIGLHLKATLFEAFIKDLHEDFSEYLATSLSRAALAGIDAGRFAGEAKLDLHAKEILETGSWDGVVRLISDKIFRALENERNTKSLIDKFGRRVGLAIDDPISSAAMPYLDARHILVHRDGRPDDLYIRNYPHIPLDRGEIAVNFNFLRDAREKVVALAEHIDAALINAKLVRREDMTGQH